MGTYIFLGSLSFILFVSIFVPLAYVVTGNYSKFSIFVSGLCFINIAYVFYLLEYFSEYLKIGV